MYINYFSLFFVFKKNRLNAVVYGIADSPRFSTFLFLVLKPIFVFSISRKSMKLLNIRNRKMVEHWQFVAPILVLKYLVFHEQYGHLALNVSNRIAKKLPMDLITSSIVCFPTINTAHIMHPMQRRQ